MKKTKDALAKDFNFKNAIPNPFANHKKVQITIRLDSQTVEFFKALAVIKGIPYQRLIDAYLRGAQLGKYSNIRSAQKERRRLNRSRN